MTALSAAANRQYKVGTLRGYPVAASTTIYKGAGVCVNTSGYAVPAADTANFRTLGVAEETVDNSSGSNGDIEVQVRAGAIHKFATAADLGQTAVGTWVFWTDDNTVGAAGSANNEVAAGVVTRYVSSSEAWIEVAGSADLPALSVATADIQDGAVTGAKVAATFVVPAVIAGGAAGNHTVTGITTSDHLIAVIRFDLDSTAANIDVDDLTSEFSITATNTINNGGGTATSGDKLLVLYINDA